MLSSKPYLELLLLGCGVLNRRPAMSHSVKRCPGGAHNHWLVLIVTDWISSSPKLSLPQNWLYLTWTFANFISQRPQISIQPRDCFRLFPQVRPMQRISDWPLSQGSICNGRIRRLYLCRGVGPPPSLSVLDMTPNCIWGWIFRPGALGM